MAAAGIIIHGDGTFHGDVYNYVNTSPPVLHDLPKTFRHELPNETPHFTGRLTTLNGIRDRFHLSTSPENCRERTVAIVGLGGTGKSQTAREFAKKYREIYPNAVWINAETQKSTSESFLRLAKKFRINPSDSLVKDVYEFIDEKYSDKVLFIFDNAIQLHSNEKEFGIFDYLPTEDLAHQRFPFVIITTQTPYWPREIKKFELDGLSEAESLEFFHSSLDFHTSECDEELKELHSLLQGYPLAMRLATSNIDFDSDKDSVDHLSKQLDLYIQKFEEQEVNQTLTEQINEQTWDSKYNQTLSTVWQLSFQRLQSEPHGENALMLLRASSFYLGAVTTRELLCVHAECPHCPNTPTWVQYDQLEKSSRLLEKFYAADCVYSGINHSEHLKALQSNSAMDLEDLTSKFQDQVNRSKSFWFGLRVHGLVKLVVRLQMDCSTVLEDIQCSQVFYRLRLPFANLNFCAVEEALKRAELTTRSLLFVGLRALQGDMATRAIVETRTLEKLVDPAATIWRLYHLDKNMEVLNTDTIEVLQRLMKLVPALSLRDQRCVTQFLLLKLEKLLTPDGLKSQEIQVLALKLFTIGRSFTDECSLPLICKNSERRLTASCTEVLGKLIIEGFTAAQMPEPRVAEIIELLTAFREGYRRRNPCYIDFHQYEDDISETLALARTLLYIIENAELHALDQAKLTTLFTELFQEIWSASAGKNMNVSLRALYTFNKLDVLVRAYVQCRRDTPNILSAIVSAFGATVVATELKLSSYLEAPPDYWIDVAIEVCSTWMFISIQEGLLCSKSLTEYISRTKVLANIRTTPPSSLRAVVKPKSAWKELRDTHATTYKIFIEKYSNSTIEAFRTLVVFGTEIQHAMAFALNSMDSHTAGSSTSRRN